MTDSILNIVAPWINREKEEQEADKEKFSELLTILDPQRMNDWFDDLHTSSYLMEKNAMMDGYFSFIDLPSTYFHRRKLTNKYKNFNKSFGNLRGFLLTHFFVNTNAREFVQLYPELKSSDPVLYSQRLSELKELIRDAQEKYNSLIVAGREKYVGTMTAIISLLLLITVAVPGLSYLIEKLFIQ